MIKAIIYAILQILDIISTKWALSNGHYEANPLMALFMYNNLPIAILIKTITTSGFLVLYFILKKKSLKTANVMIISLIVLHSLVILNSYAGFI